MASIFQEKGSQRRLLSRRICSLNDELQDHPGKEVHPLLGGFRRIQKKIRELVRNLVKQLR